MFPRLQEMFPGRYRVNTAYYLVLYGPIFGHIWSYVLHVCHSPLLVLPFDPSSVGYKHILLLKVSILISLVVWMPSNNLHMKCSMVHRKCFWHTAPMNHSFASRKCSLTPKNQSLAGRKCSLVPAFKKVFRAGLD